MENNGYETPELNEKLYLHFRGFKRIQNLEPYVACKALWLDSNGVDKIEGLTTLVELRCLYMSKNLISRIEGLETLSNLTVLDLSCNRITRLEGLSLCPSLKSLNIGRNGLTDAESIAELVACSALETLDVTNNRLDGEDVLDILHRTPALVSIAINGNEVTRVANFRKRMITSMPRLCYLDRPVDEQERLRAEAFMQGGPAAEQEAIRVWRERQKEKRAEELTVFRNWQEEHRRKSAEALSSGARSSLITEFTPEELEQREKERSDAVRQERHLLELGVSRVAEEYWRMDAQQHNSSQSAMTLLDEAVDRVRRADEKTTMTMPDDDHHDDDHNDAAQSTEVNHEQAVSCESVDDESAAAAQSASASALAATEPQSSEQLKAAEEESAARKREEEARRLLEEQERREQMEREERVAQSLYIYKKQLEQEKLRKSGHGHDSASASSAYPRSNTWGDGDDVAAATPTPLPETKAQAQAHREIKEIYWSEEMDIELAKAVRGCEFDFGRVSRMLMGLQERGTLSSQITLLGLNAADHLSADKCRQRWALLDAARWSSAPSSASALESDVNVKSASGAAAAGGEVVHRIFVQVADINGPKHGAQPSFDEMRSRVAGKAPSYLVPPKSFPTVSVGGKMPLPDLKGVESLSQHMLVHVDGDDDESDDDEAQLESLD